MVAALLLAVTGPSTALSQGTEAGVDAEVTPLRDLADFPLGVAVPAGRSPRSLLSSPERQLIVRRHFDSLTAENIMKMRYLQPRPGEFRFQHADALVAWAQQQDIIVHGHTLVWHNQAPDWMNELQGGAEKFEAVLEAHVTTVARHFAGNVVSWDVVNEVFTDDSPTRWRDTIWYRNIGPKYVELAFRWAREAAPGVDLYYNDYNISGAIGPGKLARVLEMVDDFQLRGVPIDGVGFQMHVDTEKPAPEAIRAAFAEVVKRNLKVRLSELDVSVNQRREFTALDEPTAQLQRRRYTGIVRTYLETVPPALRGGITVWGITDGDSWIPGFHDRPDWPLLFHANFEPKPALAGFAEALAGGSD